MSKDKMNFKHRMPFVVYLFSSILVIAGISYFISPLGRISNINVEGNINVTKDEIIKLSEITGSTRFWPNNLGENEKFIQKHPVIERAEINRKFPNQVEIFIKEHEKVAKVIKEGKHVLVLSNGSLLDVPYSYQEDLPLLLNWEENLEFNLIALELSEISREAMNMISEIHFAPSDINPLRIKVFMTDGMEMVGTITGFSSKLNQYPLVSTKIPDEVDGFIDMEVGFVLKPYNKDSEEGVSE